MPTMIDSMLINSTTNKVLNRLAMKHAPLFLIFFLFFTTQFVVTGNAHGAAIGMPESTLRVGYGVGLGSLSIADPSGATESKMIVQPLRVIVTDWFRGDIRYWAEFFYQDATLKATQTQIGQTVNQYGLQLSAQRSFNVIPRWSPWFGVGLDLALNNYSGRHTVASDGFLEARFSNRSETDLGFIFNMVSEMELSQEWGVGCKLEQRFSITGGTEQLSLSFFVINVF